MPRFTHTAAILGAGFSSLANIPTASRINESFLSAPEESGTPDLVNDSISHHLQRYWSDVFGWEIGEPRPSFEDHFTVLDLAANSGHNLGPYYTPKVLRALRRISIHRVFDILDTSFRFNAVLTRFTGWLAIGDGNVVVTPNWDIVIEKHLVEGGSDSYPYHYGVDASVLGANEQIGTQEGLPVIKLHGSSNWHYCDSCRSLVIGHQGWGKTSLHLFTYLEPDDFEYLDDNANTIETVQERCSPEQQRCPRCGTSLTGRVATFSFRKALEFSLFQSCWNSAMHYLVEADQWLFVGYSLPAADYEFRHLLKTAEVARNSEEKPLIEVVLKDNDDEAEDRYKRFFGNRIRVHQAGLKDWYGKLASGSALIRVDDA